MDSFPAPTFLWVRFMKQCISKAEIWLSYKLRGWLKCPSISSFFLEVMDIFGELWTEKIINVTSIDALSDRGFTFARTR